METKGAQRCICRSLSAPSLGGWGSSFREGGLRRFRSLAVFPVENHGFVEPTSWADEYKRIYKLFDEALR